MEKIYTRRLFSFMVALAVCISSMLAPAQVKVAEGEYALHSGSNSGAPSTKMITTWSLFERPTGYYLISEIHVPNSEQRVVQTEDLNAELVPTGIGYQIYVTGQKQPGVTIKCQFVSDVINCTGQSHGAAVVARPFKYRGPFWFYVSDLFALDMSWLLDGTVNMAHLQHGKAPVTTISVSPAAGQELEITAEPDGMLEFVGSEKISIAGVWLDSKHYLLKSGDDDPINLWLGIGGLLLKFRDSSGSDVVLTNYKQYKKLLPEFGIEKEPASNAASGSNNTR